MKFSRTQIFFTGGLIFYEDPTGTRPVSLLKISLILKATCIVSCGL